MTEELVVYSVTVAEVVTDDGERAITVTHEGDPAAWTVLGLLDWAVTATRLAVAVDEDV